MYLNITRNPKNPFAGIGGTIYGTPEERASLAARKQRDTTLRVLERLVERYNNEINNEQKKECPDAKFIDARVKKINEMRQTLARATQYDNSARR